MRLNADMKTIAMVLAVISVIVNGPNPADATELGIESHRFTIDRQPTFLLGISYYGALGASKESIQADLDDMQRYGFNWIRVWGNWTAFEHSVSAVDGTGAARQPYLDHLKWLVEQCDQRGIIVDVTLHRTNSSRNEGTLPDFPIHLRAVETIINSLKDHKNWYLDLANERNVGDARFVSFEELRLLRLHARELMPTLLVTASDGGDFDKDELAKYVNVAEVDFVTPHRGRSRDIHRTTATQSREYFKWMTELGKVVPLHYQEPFRRGYAPETWEPDSADFGLDLRNAISGGAAGWCFHNGAQKDHVDNHPRRSFDLSQRRLFDQLDSEELKFISEMGNITGRLRVIIETDAGGDPDDEQSLVRFLLYCNEWDVEGIICNRAMARDGENRNSARTGLAIVERMIDAYEMCYEKLVQHDYFFPTPNELRKVTIPGYSDREEGVVRIIQAADSLDPRPIWFMNWGTDHGSSPSSLKRALDQVRAERGEDGYRKFKLRFRISGDDRFGDHMNKIEPPFPIWVNTKEPELDRKRWYRRFGPLTATAGGFDIKRDVLVGHGPLGELYPTNTDILQKEGDSTEFLYLVPTGMNSPEEPTIGSWAGRYGPNESYPNRRVYWANQADAWNGTSHRENSLARWSADFQMDFKARMDWTVSNFANANHPPTPKLNGLPGRDIIHISASPGEVVKLNAFGSHDIDGDELSFQWLFYPEPSGYSSEISIMNHFAVSSEVLLPADSLGKSVHILLIVRDNGEPSLSRYRRAIIDVK